MERSTASADTVNHKLNRFLRNQLVTDAPCRFVLDETDGRAARTFNQASTLGAVLDMVTDRRGSASAEAACVHASRWPEPVSFPAGGHHEKADPSVLRLL